MVTVIRWLAKRDWGRILLAPVVVAAGGWSWLTYVFGSVPDDKKVYWSGNWGWLSIPMVTPWHELANAESVFHELKNIGAEWARAWPQTAFKVLSMFILVLTGMLLGALLALLIAVL
jgi:ABC-type phosphate/phosphonate transport system permease subunit